MTRHISDRVVDAYWASENPATIGRLRVQYRRTYWKLAALEDRAAKKILEGSCRTP